MDHASEALSECRLLLSVIIVFSSSSRLNSQQLVTAVMRDPQALHLLEESLAEMGPATKDTIVDAEAVGKLFTPSDLANPVGSFVAKVRGKDFSMETTRGGSQSRFRVLNGRGSVPSRRTDARPRRSPGRRR